jgi:hypothetical protein
VKLHACQHCFHKGCIDSWLERSLNCPLCRQSLQSGHGYVCKQAKLDIKVKKLPTAKHFRKAVRLFEQLDHVDTM